VEAPTWQWHLTKPSSHSIIHTSLSIDHHTRCNKIIIIIIIIVIKHRSNKNYMEHLPQRERERKKKQRTKGIYIHPYLQYTGQKWYRRGRNKATSLTIKTTNCPHRSYWYMYWKICVYIYFFITTVSFATLGSQVISTDNSGVQIHQSYDHKLRVGPSRWHPGKHTLLIQSVYCTHNRTRKQHDRGWSAAPFR